MPAPGPTSSPRDVDPRVLRQARRLQSDTRFDCLRPLRHRRILVTAQVLVLLCAAINSFIGGTGSWIAMVNLLLTMAAFVGLLLLRSVVRGAADYPDGAVDERVVASRNAAYLSAYRIQAAAAILALLVLWLLTLIPGRVITADLLVPLTTAYILGALSLPSAILAWSEPDV